jgi:GntR family transcriptional regulator, transcriptional repressor for pyruvate dehydrogenase complex
MSGADPITFDQVPRRKLAETVAARILTAVRDQPAGTRLPTERQLTESLGVGRSTVREALNGLALIGVVEIRHGQGVFVAERTTALPTVFELGTVEARQLHEARAVIEVEVARLAALRRTPDQLAALEELLAGHLADLQAGRPPVVQASRFHLLLAEAADNAVLASVLRPYFRLMFERGPALYETDSGYARWEYDQHRAILDAVSAGDPEQAAARMLAHVGAMSGHYADAVTERTS